MSKGESSFFSSMSVEQKQEYFAAKETKMENVKDMLSGFKDAIDNMKPEDLQSYMDSVVNLYEYSPGNQWLIYFQLLNVLNKEELAGTKPGEVSMFNLKQPSSFASMTAWNDLGRKIVK